MELAQHQGSPGDLHLTDYRHIPTGSRDEKLNNVFIAFNDANLCGRSQLSPRVLAQESNQISVNRSNVDRLVFLCEPSRGAGARHVALWRTVPTRF